MSPCPRFIEFFEVNGILAMRNLTVFITIIVASAAVLYLAYKGDLNEGIFGAYVLAGGGVYGFGKWQDDKTKREGAIDADSSTIIESKLETTSRSVSS